jgi:hypothetical protein
LATPVSLPTSLPSRLRQRKGGFDSLGPSAAGLRDWSDMLFYALALIAGTGMTAYEAYKRNWWLAAAWASATIIIAVLGFVIRPDSQLNLSLVYNCFLEWEGASTQIRK